MGPSGSGKSTLLRALVGSQRVQAGAVTVAGSPAGSGAVRGRVGYATQDAATYADLTVEQNLRYFAAVLGAGPDVARVLDRVGLRDQAHQRVDTLSGGQRGRVNLGVALLGDPEVLVLDEPTVGLDPVLRADLWQLFTDLAAQGVTVVVSSHVMEEAMRCDRLVLLREGAVLADTTPRGLMESTGAADPDSAFLRLVRGSETSG